MSGPHNPYAWAAAMRRTGSYIDPVNRARHAYLAGDIDAVELERRVGDLIGLERSKQHERSLRRLRMGGKDGGK